MYMILSCNVSNYLSFELLTELSLKGMTFYVLRPSSIVYVNKIVCKRWRMIVKLFFLRKKNRSQIAVNWGWDEGEWKIPAGWINWVYASHVSFAWHSSGIPRFGGPQTSINVIWIFQAIRQTTKFAKCICRAMNYFFDTWVQQKDTMNIS